MRRRHNLLRSSSCAGLRARSRGFTILELMVTVAVGGILSMVVIPELTSFLKNSASRQTSYDLMSSLMIARSEAIKRGSRVVLCRTENPHAPTPSCGGEAKNWSTGWLVFIAEDGDSEFDVGTDVLVTVGDATSNGINLRSNGVSDSSVEFRADGSLTAASTARFVICDERGAAAGRQLNVAKIGRADVEVGTAADPLATCTPS
ncbi:MAG: GspH/FimT family pseudopilin [Gammaproteobacteria bacterium]